MTDKRDLSAVTEPVTEDELLAVLLDMTGDLDKARVLRKTLPAWLVEAKPATLAALEKAHSDSEQPRRLVKALLERLQPLHEFCVERLHTFLLSKGVETVDVERDQLEIPTRRLTGLLQPLGGALIETVSWEKQSLVQAAMCNFDAAKARRGGIAEGALIRSASTEKAVPGLSVQQFVEYCRELDLGAAYQRHLCEVFGVQRLGQKSEEAGLSFNAAAMPIGLCKRLDMQIDLHIACAKEHVSSASAEYMLKLIKADRPASELGFLTPVEKPWIWQGLNLDGACLWGALVVCADMPDALGAGSFLVYMPNEPVRPWYEYDSLEDFERYLTHKLQDAAYRRFFERYLDEYERFGFFQRFDQGKRLGKMEPVAVTSGFTAFYFDAFSGKIQRDALALAVPTAQVDEDADEARWQAYLEAGLNLLNVAAFVVPVLGELMLGVAVGQILGEVFDGVEDWLHDDNAEALRHLVSVTESLVAMVAFAVGGRIVGALKARVTSREFFAKVEAVTRSDHRPALWRPRLAPYGQVLKDEGPWLTNSKGVYQAQGQSWIRIDGTVYMIAFDPGIGQWRIKHPLRPTAYRPPLIHNHRGGWQHVFERPERWENLRYNLTRLNPELEELPAEHVEAIADITGVTGPQARSLALENTPLPQRFQDCVVRVRQHQRVADAIGQLERGEALNADTARIQMLGIPLMEGWPKGRFIEVLDDEDYLLESYPDLAPFDYEDLSIHVTQRQLAEGQVMRTLLQALSQAERDTLLGETVALDNAPAVLERRLLPTLKANHQRLTQQLFLDQEGTPAGELLALKNGHPQISNRMAWELLSQASEAQRRRLRITGRVPLTLAERARGALAQMDEDRALTGLYFPEEAVPETRRIALGVLQQLPGWPRDVSLQLREQTVRGPLLGRAGSATASVQRTVVQTAEGFQAFDEASQPVGKVAAGPLGFYQALVDAMPARHCVSLNLQGEYAAQRLLDRISLHTRNQRRRVPAYLRDEPRALQDEPTLCLQAAPPFDPASEPVLVRKLKKLFPRLDDYQLADLAQDGGDDHLSRAKAVEALERQFESLRRSLKVWRSDRSAYNLKTFPRWDFRLTRHQVARAIRKSWQRMTLVLDHQRRSALGLSLDDMLRDPLPTLPPEVNFEPLRILSLRRMALDDGVAYFLKHFKGLMSLDLAGNQITRVPQVLSQMPQLEYLCLADNALHLNEYALNTLSGLRSLQVLNLTNNPLLDPPDVSRMFVLRELVLRNCRLKTFPKGVSRLPYLESLDLRENDITELPEWLLRVPRSYAQTVNLRHNPLNEASQQLLHDYRTAHGVGMGYLEDDITRMTEQAARDLWLADDRVDSFADKDQTWAGLRDEPGSEGLFTLLARLGGAADTSHVREEMDRRVWRVLDATATDSELREEVFQRAASPLNCDDAAAVSFSNLEVLVEIHHAGKLAEDGRVSTPELLRLGKGLFRLDQLDSLAFDHSQEHPSADPLEVSLAYRTGLANRFDLPGQPRHMRFAQLGGVTAQHLNDAENLIKSAELSPKLLDYLVELPFWVQHLKRKHAQAFETMNDPLDVRMEAVFKQRMTLGDTDYRDQMNVIRDDQAKAERAELERLTLNAMEQSDLGGCLMP